MAHKLLQNQIYNQIKYHYLKKWVMLVHQAINRPGSGHVSQWYWCLHHLYSLKLVQPMLILFLILSERNLKKKKKDLIRAIEDLVVFLWQLYRPFF